MSKQTDKRTETNAEVSSTAPNTGDTGQEIESQESSAGGDADAGSEQGQPVTSDSAQDDRSEERQRIAELESTLAELEKRLGELEQENAALKERYLRKQADFENFRKRMQREKQEFGAYTNKQLLLDLVTVIDDFERAIESAEESRDFDSFYDGIVLIERQMTSMLERKWGLQRFDSEGAEFDPQRHEAVTAEHTGEENQPVMIEDYQKGYMLHDRVLRSAKVKVAMPSPNAGSGDQNGKGTEQQESAGDTEGRHSSDSHNH